ncbi:MAG TPA: EamA family transporter [Edaphocola sp.]|nr:EamA family transporter [Edaphocola sp.]
MSVQTKAWLALIFICLAWGTTYFGIKIALGAFPPFLMAGIRQFIAGLIIFLMAFSNKLKKDFSINNILRQALIGFLLITLGNGLVSWAEVYIPSGVAALICAVIPIATVVVSLMIQKNEKVNIIIIVGMVLGFLGVAINFKDSIGVIGQQQYTIGIFAVFIATLAWAFGTVISKRNPKDTNPIFNSAIQVTAGGILLLPFSLAFDNYQNIHLENTQGLLGVLYLIIIGSVLAYTVYMYALKHLPIGVVMIYSYINPLVAILLGWWLANEPLNLYTFISFTCIISGLLVVYKGYKKLATKKIIVA